MRHLAEGICRDMLARNQPLELRLTKNRNTDLYEICRRVIQWRNSNSGVWEVQGFASTEDGFNYSQILGLPVVLLSRCLTVSDPNHPYREQHSSTDNLEFAELSSLTNALEAVIELITVTEHTNITTPKPSHEPTSPKFD